MRHAAALGSLLLMACGGSGDTAAPPAQTGEPGAQEQRMLKDAAAMLDEEAAEPPLPADTGTPDRAP